MGTRVTGDRDRAAMYDSTSGIAFGPTYTGYSDARKELTEFIGWLPKKPNRYTNSQLERLMTAFKVENGWMDRKDWERTVEEAEDLLGREIED